MLGGWDPDAAAVAGGCVGSGGGGGGGRGVLADRVGMVVTPDVGVFGG
jgi:hypothetical protein